MYLFNSPMPDQTCSRPATLGCASVREYTLSFIDFVVVPFSQPVRRFDPDRVTIEWT
jgi:hypothetical protein